MSNPIWPVVTENLAEQLAATQGGKVHPVQLLPYLPMSLQLIETTLDELTESARVAKKLDDGLVSYEFNEHLDKAPTKFQPTKGIYSDDPLDEVEFTAISTEVRSTLQVELGILAEEHPWPGNAIWQHELLYLLQNLPAPVSLSAIAGHSRLPFKKVEEKMAELVELGAVQYNVKTKAYDLPPMSYPKKPYKRHDEFVRQFPGALKEETEMRLVKGLIYSLVIAVVCLGLAITAKIPFPIVLIGGTIVAGINFARILFARPKPLPVIN